MANNNITGQNDENAQMMSLINIMAQQRLREQSLVHQAQMTGTPYTPPPQSSNPLQDMTVILGMVQQLNQASQNTQAQTSGGDRQSVQPASGTGNDAADTLSSFSQAGRTPATRRDIANMMGQGGSLWQGDIADNIYQREKSASQNKFQSLKDIFHAIGGLFDFLSPTKEQRGDFPKRDNRNVA